MAASHSHPKPFTGKHMLAIMIAFFGVIIAVNMTMAYLASSSWTGLVVQNSYVASQEFNGELDKARAQSKLGWSTPLMLSTEEALVEARDANGKPIKGAEVILLLQRSMTDRDDQAVTLTEVAPGLYRAAVDLAPVHWKASLRLKAANGVTYRQDHQILLKAGE
ncbi:MAG: FixH family protein [Alphaproteobacteria bacterium]|nr:FixH family protein [Alphaproteobacteria bacterium]